MSNFQGWKSRRSHWRKENILEPSVRFLLQKLVQCSPKADQHANQKSKATTSTEDGEAQKTKWSPTTAKRTADFGSKVRTNLSSG